MVSCHALGDVQQSSWTLELPPISHYSHLRIIWVDIKIEPPPVCAMIDGMVEDWQVTSQSLFIYLLDGFISKLFLVAIFNFRNLNWRYLHIQGLCMGYVTGYTPKAFLVWYLQFRYLKWPLILVTTSRPSFRGCKTPLNSPTSYCLTHWILCACWTLLLSFSAVLLRPELW